MKASIPITFTLVHLIFDKVTKLLEEGYVYTYIIYVCIGANMVHMYICMCAYLWARKSTHRHTYVYVYVDVYAHRKRDPPPPPPLITLRENFLSGHGTHPLK
jgi:hypothetical protein